MLQLPARCSQMAKAVIHVRKCSFNSLCAKALSLAGRGRGALDDGAPSRASRGGPGAVRALALQHASTLAAAMQGLLLRLSLQLQRALGGGNKGVQRGEAQASERGRPENMVARVWGAGTAMGSAGARIRSMQHQLPARDGRSLASCAAGRPGAPPAARQWGRKSPPGMLWRARDEGRGILIFLR